jgi:hypothetical protein
MYGPGQHKQGSTGAEAETCFEIENENKYFYATLAFDDWKFREHNECVHAKTCIIFLIYIIVFCLQV